MTTPITSVRGQVRVRMINQNDQVVASANLGLPAAISYCGLNLTAFWSSFERRGCLGTAPAGLAAPMAVVTLLHVCFDQSQSTTAPRSPFWHGCCVSRGCIVRMSQQRLDFPRSEVTAAPCLPNTSLQYARKTGTAFRGPEKKEQQ